MDLDTAIKGIFDAEGKLRSTQGVDNPVFISENMMRLSHYTGAAENHLAEYEKDYEIKFATELKIRMFEELKKVTQAEREVDIELAELKGQIKYLTRLIASAWKQVGVAQSRFNHLTTLASTQV